MTTCLGDKIKVLRKEKGLTLDKLANEANISKSYLWELENRESKSPSAEKLQAIAKQLGTTTDYFLDNFYKEPQEKHRDDVFFRNYEKLGPDDKEQLRKILDTFQNK